MTTDLEICLYIFMLAGFLGYHLITRIPPLLHTPLMSATNAIAAISLVGSLVVAGSDYSHVPHGWICATLGFLAVTCSTTNAVGGFLITDRMLGMFKRSGEQRGNASHSTNIGLVVLGVISVVVIIFAIYWKRHHAGHAISGQALKYSYIISAAMFILGLKGLGSPKWARRGIQLAACGMLLAVLGTLFDEQI